MTRKTRSCKTAQHLELRAGALASRVWLQFENMKENAAAGVASAFIVSTMWFFCGAEMISFLSNLCTNWHPNLFLYI